MPIGATLGVAAAGLGSAVIGSSAAKSAASTQAAAAAQSAQLQAGAMDRATAAQSTAAQNALGFQNKAFDYTTGTLFPYEQGIYNNQLGDLNNAGTTANNYLSGARGDIGGYISGAQSLLRPQIDTGTGANYTLAQLYGLPTPGNPSGGQADAASKIFAASPDYNFALQQGQLGVDRSNAAKGLTLSGGQIKDTATFNQGLATQTFGNYYNRLLSLSQLGTQAAGTNAQLASTGANLSGNLGTTGANVSANLAGARGNLTSSMIAGTNQVGSTAGGIANSAGSTGVSAANALGQTIVGGTQGIGNTIQQGAQATASGIVGASNAITGGLNMPAAYAMNSQLRPNNNNSSFSDQWATSALNPSGWGNQPMNISPGSYQPSSMNYIQ